MKVHNIHALGPRPAPPRAARPPPHGTGAGAGHRPQTTWHLTRHSKGCAPLAAVPVPRPAGRLQANIATTNKATTISSPSIFKNIKPTTYACMTGPRACSWVRSCENLWTTSCTFSKCDILQVRLEKVEFLLFLNCSYKDGILTSAGDLNSYTHAYTFVRCMCRASSNISVSENS